MKRKILSLAILSFIIIKACPQTFASKIIRSERSISKEFIAVDKAQKISFNASEAQSLPCNSMYILHTKNGKLQSSTYGEYRAVYINYNNDVEFTDARGQAINRNGTEAVSKPAFISSIAKSGATGMHIIMHDGRRRTAACGTFSDGETEDYAVNITGGTFAGVASLDKAGKRPLTKRLADFF